MIHLGVNIDHVATVRQARQASEPDPVRCAVLAELGGADGITVHLRGDRRHIQDRDVRLLSETVTGKLNLEMAVGEGVLELAESIKPQQACLVPEKREELTTEGGLRLRADDERLADTIARLKAVGIAVSLFIEPDEDAIRLAAELGADSVELHTGTWANAWLAAQRSQLADLCAKRDRELQRLEHGAVVAKEVGLALHAGHGITYQNVHDLVHLPGLHELNIGHSIVARALFVGMQQAVADMRAAIDAHAI